MSSSEDRSREADFQGVSTPRRSLRPLSFLLTTVLALTQIPIASAHGATATGGLSQGHGVIITIIGALLLVGTTLLKRTGRLSPTAALYGVFVGISVTALGAIIFEGVSPDPVYAASSIPFPRSWYLPLGLGVGLLIMGGSFVIGRLRWPGHPRYTFFGILMGLWISYPYLIPGSASTTHPLGYAIVLGTPLFVGYIIWKDTGGVLRRVLRDPVARRFGVGVSIVLALFFLAITGYLSVFPEEGFPDELTVLVLSADYQLVMWPILEIAIPHIPFFLALSPGQLAIVGTLSALIGLNAAVIARHWRVEERAGLTEGTAGGAAIVGTCTCGCCGPLVAKIAVLAAGPAIAAPLYWIFVDTASPLSALFIVGSLVLFTGSLIYSIQAARQPGGSASIGPAD